MWFFKNFCDFGTFFCNFPVLGTIFWLARQESPTTPDRNFTQPSNLEAIFTYSDAPARHTSHNVFGRMRFPWRAHVLKAVAVDSKSQKFGNCIPRCSVLPKNKREDQKHVKYWKKEENNVLFLSFHDHIDLFWFYFVFARFTRSRWSYSCKSRLIWIPSCCLHRCCFKNNSSLIQFSYSFQFSHKIYLKQ